LRWQLAWALRGLRGQSSTKVALATRTPSLGAVAGLRWVAAQLAGLLRHRQLALLVRASSLRLATVPYRIYGNRRLPV